MRITSLASGSKGNCYYIETAGARVLIDCGISLKQVEERLQSINVSASSIQYILITHEHSDHIAGIENFYKKYKPKIYCNYLSTEKIETMKPLLMGNITTFNNEQLKIGDIVVEPIEVSHDSVFCTSYKLTCGNASVCVLTDLGEVDSRIIEKVRGCKVIYLESNHDEYMLKNCHYPSIIKSRIASRNGHLSNTQAGECMVKLLNFGTRHFVLSHISQNSNTYEQAYITIANILVNNGINPQNDVVIRFAHQDRVSNNFNIGEV